MLEHRNFVKFVQSQIPGFPIAVFSEGLGERTIFACFPNNETYIARVYCAFALFKVEGKVVRTGDHAFFGVVVPTTEPTASWLRVWRVRHRKELASKFQSYKYVRENGPVSVEIDERTENIFDIRINAPSREECDELLELAFKSAGVDMDSPEIWVESL